ncbi:Hypothetical predicted protein [Mytilus galloprovincialis]|uniref:FLYWCH-type domain-containing protein n=2 Tax=Mytilus TaxID=6548 RepID=A0A8B6GLS7_MYTGA|nr:Hypothetical predicted protein [Mytilus galloprovincialis]
MEVIKSNKGGSKLCYQGYMYTKHTTRKTVQWWKCVKRSSTACKGSITTSLQNENPTPGQPHNHDPSDISIKYTKSRYAMKEQAALTRDKPSQIFAQVVSTCEDDVQAMMPREENCKRTMRNQRPTPPVPQSFVDVTLPAEFTITTNHQQFLLYDNGQNAENRMLVFCSPDSLRRLAEAHTFFMDGTFSVAPHPFKQLYTIRVPFKDVTVTTVYAFLPNKNQDTYRELFQSLVDKCQASHLQLNVQTVVTDFEDGVLRAVSAVFGRHINNQGCFYHLTQATWRKIQSLGLVPHYKISDDFRLFCGMMDGLAFLPVADLPNGVHLLRTLCPDDPPEAAELLDYFDATYVSGNMRRNPAPGQGLRLVMRRTPPMFPPTIWNVHDATVNGDSRTNNVCEGWNNKFFNLVGYAHPSIWRVVEWCQKEEATVRTLIQQDAVGTPPVKRVQQRYVQLQLRLQNLCRDLTSGNKTIAEFLRGVGWNIRLNH